MSRVSRMIFDITKESPNQEIVLATIYDLVVGSNDVIFDIIAFGKADMC